MKKDKPIDLNQEQKLELPTFIVATQKELISWEDHIRRCEQALVYLAKDRLEHPEKYRPVAQMFECK